MLPFTNASQTTLSDIFGNPDFIGAEKRYSWADIEPTKNNYDFSSILSDINYLSADNKHLVVQLKVNAHDNDPANVPNYLLTEPIYAGGVMTDAGNTICKRWNTHVIDRLDSLYIALAAVLNSNPLFDGIVFDETAAPIGDCGTPGDYTAQGHRDGMMKDMTNARNAFDSTKFVIQYMNSFHCLSSSQQVSYFQVMANHGDSIHAGIGGPDINLTYPRVKAYPVIPAHDGIIPLGEAVQNADYGYINPNTGKTVTAEDILIFGADSLKLDYIFWLDKSPNFADDVVPTLAKYRPQCSTTSLKTPQQKDDLILLFPNPSSGKIQVLNSKCEKLDMEVYNMFGEKISQFTISKPEYSIDTSSLPGGIYFVRINSNKEIIVKKIVIE